MDDDRNAPASKADLAELETRIVDQLTEVMRDVLTVLEERLLEVEKRLNMPPAA